MLLQATLDLRCDTGTFTAVPEKNVLPGTKFAQPRFEPLGELIALKPALVSVFANKGKRFAASGPADSAVLNTFLHEQQHGKSKREHDAPLVVVACSKQFCFRNRPLSPLREAKHDRTDALSDDAMEILQGPGKVLRISGFKELLRHVTSFANLRQYSGLEESVAFFEAVIRRRANEDPFLYFAMYFFPQRASLNKTLQDSKSPFGSVRNRPSSLLKLTAL
jgi:hypothetical protein